MSSAPDRFDDGFDIRELAPGRLLCVDQFVQDRLHFHAEGWGVLTTIVRKFHLQPKQPDLRAAVLGFFNRYPKTS